jgi:hypothetical protein
MILIALGAVALHGVAAMPAGHSADPHAAGMAAATVAFSLPALAWGGLAFGRPRSRAFDVLDPLTVGSLPTAGFFWFHTIVRVAETRPLPWS